MNASKDLPEPLRRPLVARLPPERADFGPILEAHERALRCGRATYRDPASGYDVFTAAALWARGECCDAGCRHCPFAFGPRHA